MRKHFSDLAGRTEKGRTAGLPLLADALPATWAGLAGAAIDRATQLETAGAAVAVHIVAHAAAAGGKRFGERAAHRADQFFRLGQRQAAGGAKRRNSGAEQAFRRVNVADADHAPRIHQKGFDRLLPAGALRDEPGRAKALGKRLDAQDAQARVYAGIGARLPGKQPETAWIAKAQAGVRKDEIDVVVRAGRRFGRHEAQTAGHAQVHDQPATCRGKVKKQIFAAPADVGEQLARQVRADFRRYCPAQIGAPGNAGQEFLADEVR